MRHSSSRCLVCHCHSCMDCTLRGKDKVQEAYGAYAKPERINFIGTIGGMVEVRRWDGSSIYTMYMY